MHPYKTVAMHAAHSSENKPLHGKVKQQKIRVFESTANDEQEVAASPSSQAGAPELKHLTLEQALELQEPLS